MSFQIVHADCVDFLGRLRAECVDAFVQDPPYGLAFMGKGWDHAVPGPEYFAAQLRVAKPGAHLVAFGGTRTYHRLACAIEEAGWELRDNLCWLFGSGFPKSHNIGKAIDKAAGAAQWEGWGTALKPGWEPIILARKPFKATVAKNVLEHGTGGLNIDGCRIGTDDELSNHGRAPTVNGWGPRMSGGQSRGATRGQALGRWPANVILDPEAGAMLDAEVGVLKTHGGGDRASVSRAVYGTYGATSGQPGGPPNSGGPSRFYYCAKASRSEREAGLEDFGASVVDDGRDTPNDTAYQRGKTERRNTHPTVKPIELMRWLVRLVTPPGGIVCDPFCGSGSTGCAAVAEGFEFIGIEREAEYVALAEARVKEWSKAT